MTYVYEYVVGNDNVKVEYCHSSITDSIKVVDMWVNGKFHRTNWMSPEGNKMLMARLEKDMEDRMCGTMDDDSMIEPFMKANNMFDEDEVDVITDHIETEVDLDRDMPGFEGTWNTLKQVGV